MRISEIFCRLLIGNIYEDLKVKAFCEAGHCDSLKLLKIYKEKRKMGSLKALYKGRRWVGILPLKILGKMSAIGLTFHHWMQGHKAA